ncbi:helix-turn-helix transcriptional regulator [Undibacterium fentianense]|uniref:WYL domain-containing transcriptional regulator n=1 Tax=Undibacterium fentianense TaxID=2828728 RepID=A0A941IFG1_9BURK|nr:WYL domain-containing transcriptional regulator [Undibacterium fentianense]MBR7799005.1 WYL domain-containing transcriptional regulator [Undibacterium fentianense]
MTSENHETLVYRLSQILVKLNQGQKLVPKELAEEFGVNIRTIQRDLNLRFAYLPLEKNGGSYQMDVRFLGQLSTKDISRFAGLAGVKGLFPSLSDDFLSELFDTRIEKNLHVQGHDYEDVSERSTDFTLLEKAIRHRKRIRFTYRKADVVKQYENVCPYKLINSKGIWYLAAVDGNTLKSYSFAKISELGSTTREFLWDSEIEQQLLDEDGIWFSAAKQTLKLSVSKEVAIYFKRRKLIPLQKIEKEHSDGRLIVSTTIAHLNQIFPIIRYWIPYIRILEPLALQTKLELELSDYLKNRGFDSGES